MNVFRRFCFSFMTVIILLSLIVTPGVAQDEASIPSEAPVVAGPGVADESADGQEAAYSISGRVTDASRNGLAGVTISARIDAPYPVILLPGIMGSRLESKPRDDCKLRPGGIV